MRTGYVFLGWSTTENGPAEYQNGVKVLNLTATHNGTVTLYAVWEELVVPAPSIAPADGATFSTDSCEVSSACTLEGAAIYYTTNGTTPKVSASYLHTQPFKVYGTVSVKAVAVVDTVKSAYATATINKVDPVPVAMVLKNLKELAPKKDEVPELIRRLMNGDYARIWFVLWNNQPTREAVREILRQAAQDWLYAAERGGVGNVPHLRSERRKRRIRASSAGCWFLPIPMCCRRKSPDSSPLQ